MNAGKPDLGSTISLIPKADIKSEGRLFTVDPQECTNAIAALASDRLRAQLAELIVEKITWENTERNLKEEMEKLQREVLYLQRGLSGAADLIKTLAKPH